MDKNINISFKTNTLNNLINNKTEHFNIYDTKGVCKTIESIT